MAMPAMTCGSLPRDIPSRGVYLFSEMERHLYVGRSNRLRARICNHGRQSATHRQAAFAFRLAREASGMLKATYKPAGSRQQLMTDTAFAATFVIQKARIARMQVRFLEEPDPVRQCLLEIYVAQALQTPYNDFDNH